MMSPSDFVQPPSVAIWLLDQLAPRDEPILGDLLEEFSLRASESGVGVARLWYWRQTLKTAPYLFRLAFRSHPWSTLAAIAGSSLVTRPMARAIQPTIFFWLEKYHVYEHHFGVYMFFASTGMDIAMLSVFSITGLIGALSAKGREMVVTMVLALVHLAMVIVAVVVVLMRHGYDPSFWRIGWYLADTLAIVVPGVIVRRYRSRIALGRA